MQSIVHRVGPRRPTRRFGAAVQCCGGALGAASLACSNASLMTRPSVRLDRSLACLSAIALASCVRRVDPAPTWLSLTQVRPIERAEVFLNERVVLHFSEPLDPASVHPGSVRIVGEGGRVADGLWWPSADRLEFTPSPVRSPDLSDGGFRPGANYTVQLLGFPAPDGLRGRSGAPLQANQRFELRVVAADPNSPRSLFEDSSPTRGLPLVLNSPLVSEGEPILLLGEEPLDPSSLDGADFELVKRSSSGSLHRSTGIELTARLVQNSDKRAVFPSGATVVELRPRQTPLEPGNYVLRLSRDGRVDDLGGHAVMLVSPTSTRWLELRVEAGRRTHHGGLASYLESFASSASRSAEVWEDADGTALWTASGRVEVTLARVCGDGADGELDLSGALEAADSRATRVQVGRENDAQLSATSNLVVLRAQTSIRIDGQLRRVLPTSTAPDCDSEWFAALRSSPLESSEALQRMEREGVRATVIVAGGDLVIEGRLECSTPLILIAGGRIRVSRQAVVEAPRLWFLDPTTENLAHQVRGHRIGAGERLAWGMERARTNLLRTPLRVAVLSSSLPPSGAARFEFGPRVTLHHGAGRARVRYLGDRPVGSTSRSRSPLVDDPALLVGCSTLRLLIELEVLPGDGSGLDPWDPPWVDDVLIEFEPARGAAR